MDAFRSELRYAVRGCLRQPGFAAAVILTLGLGLGTTTSMFSVADAELWRPLPFPRPHELVAIYARGPEPRASNDPVSGADLIDWRSGAPAFKSIAGYGRSSRRTLRAGLAESVRVSTVTPNYFATLGRRPLAGTTIDWMETCGPDAAVVTERAWRRLFGGDPAIVGRVVPLDDASLVICGIVADDDAIGSDPDLYVAFDERSAAFLDRAAPVIVEGIIGRLDGPIDGGIAVGQLNAAAASIAAEFPAGRAGHAVFIEDLRDYWRRDSNRSRLYFLLGAAIAVLVLSWVNAASLLLSRAVRRTREFAVRGALGGGRLVIARMLLAEGVVLAGASGVLGGVFTTWMTGVFTANLPPDFLRGGDHVPLDLRAWACACLLTAMTVTVFCLAPYWGSRRMAFANALRADARAGRSGREGRATNALLTAQIALTVILMAGAGVFLKSFVALTRAPLGFDPIDAVSVRVTVSGPRYGTEGAVRGFADDVRGRLRSLAGVHDAAIATSSPLGSGLLLLARPDRPKPAPGEDTRSIFRAVSPEYFRTLRIPVVRGRAFSDGDVAGAPRVAIINQVAARRLFGDEDPLGRDVELLDSPRASRWTRRPGIARIVGIAANVKEVGVHEVAFPDIYLPYAQAPSPSIEFVLRTAVPLSALREPAQTAIAATDPAIPVTSLSTFTERVAADLRGGRFNAVLVAAFASLAILLASVGIHAAVTYAVAGRTREFGVRLALGAQPGALIRSMLTQSGRIGLLGAALGLAGTLTFARLLGDAWYLVPGQHNGLLFGVTTTDPTVLTVACAGVIVVAIAAAAIPARRVGRVDPVSALRSE